MHPIMIRVAVGSKNPCKIEAARKAFEDAFVKRNSNETTTSNDNDDPTKQNVQIEISSYSVPSGTLRVC